MLRSKNKVLLILWLGVLLLMTELCFGQSTSWTGTTSTSWSTTTNWTNGVPTGTTDAIIGDANFTGSFHPSITSSSNCLSLTIGGTVAATLSINQKLTLNGNLTVNSNGTINHGRGTVTIFGNWNNSGSYSANHAQSRIIFAGTSQSINGSSSTPFRKVVVNAGTILTFNQNFQITGSSNPSLTMNGTLIPSENPTYQITGNGSITVSSTGLLKINASTFGGNYGVTGSININAGSIVEYSANAINQTISSSYTYTTLRITGNTTKTLGGNLPVLNSSAASNGNIEINSGTLDLSTFTANRGTSVAGGNLYIANGATLKIGGTNTIPSNYANYSFDPLSNVEYSGTNQTVSAKSYGNLILSSSSGAATKTMPGSSFTVLNDFSSNIGSGTSVSYTAASNIYFSGNVTVGSSTTFNGGSYTHQVSGNFINNGTFTGNSSTIEMAGNGKSLSGSGNHNFFNLTSSGLNITTSISSLNITGNLSTTSIGTFTQSSGTLIMSGSTKSISGTGITLNDLNITGTISSTSVVTIAGNLSVGGGGNFTTTGGSIIMSGGSKSINNSGTLNLYDLTPTGSITTSSSFTITSALSVSGSFTATAGTLTFAGTSTLYGTANLYDVAINGTSLRLGGNSVLGIANSYALLAGILDVTSSTPNTVNFNGSSNKNIASGTFHHLTFTGNTNTAVGILTVNGDLTINSSTTFVASNFTHSIKGNWHNNGTFTPGSGTIQFDGAADGNILGATTFNNISINKSSSNNNVNLQNNITTATITMTQGRVRTNVNTLTITNTRTGNGIILGNIQRTHSFTTGVAYEFESPQNTITFSSVSGVSSITVKVSTGAGAVPDFPFGGSINRQYEILVPTGTYNATLRLHYEDGELNGNSETAMNLWRYNSVWTNAFKSGNNSTQNYVEQTGLTNIVTRWTFSDDNNVIGWHGSVSNEWHNPANWTGIQGSPSGIPSLNDVVQIGFASYTYAPVISTAATAKNISFGSSVASTLSLTTSGSLTVEGNISGTWTGNATHTINTNGQSITVNGDAVLSDGTAGHAINLNIGNGSISMTGSLTQTGGANIAFSGSGNLAIGNNFNYTNGTFSAGTGTVTYNGNVSQSIASVPYNHLVINSTGIASINTATTVGGNLSVTTGQLDINAASSIAGSVTISAGGVLNSGNITTSVGGNWINSGTFIPFSGTVNFNGSSSQTISASPFNNLSVNNSSGAVLNGNITIAGNINIQTGTLNISTYTANRSIVGGSLTIANGANLLVGGANNFPSNYTTYTLGNSSTVNYNGSIAQTVAGITYGNLTFSNGTSNAKTLSATTTLNGDLTINSGATLNASSFNINLNGNWINNGTFTPSSGTVNLLGSGKTISGTTTFNKLSVFGSYSVPSGNNTLNGLFLISTGSSFSYGTGTLTVSGDLTHNGSLTSSGTTTFSGTALQTIQFTNTLTTNLNIVNFNGTIAPAFSANSSPTFATVNINNTGGISVNTGWIVTTAFNISSGTSFSAGTGTHLINGSFTNNGTITSSGILNFGPASSQTIQLKGTSFSSTGNVIFSGSGAISVTGIPNTITNVTVSNTTGVSPASGWTVSGNFNVNTNGIFNAGSNTYTVAGNVQINGQLNGGTSTFNLTSSSGTVSGGTGCVFYHFTITGTIASASDYRVSGNFTNNGSYDGTGGALIMTGSGASTIGGSAGTYNMDQLSIQKSSGNTATLNRNLTQVSSLDITTGTLDASTFTITEESTSGGLLSISNGASLNIKGTNTLPSFTSYSLDTASTVEYAGSTQTISSATAYGNIVISATGNKTASSALSIQNNFSLSNGTFIGGNNNHAIGGNWTMTGGTFTNTNTTITFNGKGTQNISSTGNFNHLTTNKTSGEISLSGNITVAGTLNFTAGKIRTNAYTLTTSSGTITGAGQSTGWVIGNFQRSFSSGTLTGTFPLGGNTYYSPLTLTFASVTTGGGVTASATNTAHSNILASGITADKNIPRYWTLTNSGGVVSSSYTVSLTWNIAENYAGLNTQLIRIAKYTASNWSFPNITGTPTTTNIQANGITSFGDFAVGENCNVSSGFMYASSPYCTSAGSASVTYLNGGIAGTFTASPSGLSLNSSTGQITLGSSTAGTYIVTNTVNGTVPAGCYTATTASVTITQAFSATISYPGSPYCYATGTATVTLIGTTGGNFSSTAGLSLNTSTGNVNLSASSPGTYTVTYTVPAANGCSQFSTNNTITISGSWTGNNSTDWNDPGNWACNAVPNSTANVTIPSSAVNFPVVNSGTFAVNDLTIDNGATLTFNGCVFQIAGNINNNGIIFGIMGSLEMTGTSHQIIPAGLFDNDLLNNLTIKNNSDVALNGPLKIAGFLKARNGNLYSNGYLTLLSDASQTALIDGSGNGEVFGDVTMQRYLSSGFGYRYVSSPFQFSTVNELGDDMNLSAAFPSFYKYNESLASAGWVNYTNASGLLNPMEGYAVNFGSSQTPKTIDITGEVNNHVISKTIYNNNQTFTQGFNLIGNPYPSPIDWDAPSGWNRINIDDAIYYFNPGITNQYTGTYSSYINGISSDAIANNIIPSLQGFFVHVSNGAFPVAGTIDIDNAARINNLNPVYHKTTGSDKPLVRLSVNMDGDSTKDNFVVYFDENATTGFDKYLDALKLNNTDTLIPCLYGFASGRERLSISGIPVANDTDRIVPLGLKISKDGIIRFQAKDILKMPEELHIFLVDAATNTTQDLVTNKELNISVSRGIYDNRFFLYFTKNEKVQLNQSGTINAWSQNGKLYINLDMISGEHGELIIRNIMGQVVCRKQLTGFGTHVLDHSFANGIYLVSFSGYQSFLSRKLFIEN